MSKRRRPVTIRNTRFDDADQIEQMCRLVYPRERRPWDAEAIASHLNYFPHGQLVAADPDDDRRVLGMAASLVLLWDDYDFHNTWDQLTDRGFFSNHNPQGHTLYGAEIMVHPDAQGMGVGKQIYAARRELCRSLGLRRIRAGARLRGYHRHADRMTPQQYVVEVVNRSIGDPTLTFQLKQGFRVIAVVENYIEYDHESQGHAAVIEWINHQVATRADYRRRDPAFGKRRRPRHDDPPTGNQHPPQQET